MKQSVSINLIIFTFVFIIITEFNVRPVAARSIVFRKAHNSKTKIRIISYAFLVFYNEKLFTGQNFK